MRLVSLLPSATEIVYALGLGDDLAGVTFECDEPPSARAEKTIVVGGRDTSGMSPGEIDQYVRDRVAAGADLYTLHARALAGLAPELIAPLVRPGRWYARFREKSAAEMSPGLGVDGKRTTDDICH